MIKNQTNITIEYINVLIGIYNLTLLQWPISNIATLFNGQTSTYAFSDIVLDKNDTQGTGILLMHVHAGNNNVIQFKGLITITNSRDKIQLDEEQIDLIKKCMDKLLAEYVYNQIEVNSLWNSVQFPQL